jgi:hypothetical protein
MGDFSLLSGAFLFLLEIKISSHFWREEIFGGRYFSLVSFSSKATD